MEEKWAAYKRAWIELPVNSCFIWCTNSDNDDLLTKMLIDDR